MMERMDPTSATAWPDERSRPAGRQMRRPGPCDCNSTRFSRRAAGDDRAGDIGTPTAAGCVVGRPVRAGNLASPLERRASKADSDQRTVIAGTGVKGFVSVGVSAPPPSRSEGEEPSCPESTLCHPLVARAVVRVSGPDPRCSWRAGSRGVPRSWSGTRSTRGRASAPAGRSERQVDRVLQSRGVGRPVWLEFDHRRVVRRRYRCRSTPLDERHARARAIREQQAASLRDSSQSCLSLASSVSRARDREFNVSDSGVVWP